MVTSYDRLGGGHAAFAFDPAEYVLGTRPWMAASVPPPGRGGKGGHFDGHAQTRVRRHFCFRVKAEVMAASHKRTFVDRAPPASAFTRREKPKQC